MKKRGSNERHPQPWLETVAAGPRPASDFTGCAMTMATTQAEAPERRDLFLSHRTVDKELARRLAADIEAERAHGHALRVWLDEAEIRSAAASRDT